MIDMSCHDGLRGIAAIWIMIFHCTDIFLDLQANSMMPLFFILSGFSLTVVYGLRASKLTNKQDCDNFDIEQEVQSNNISREKGKLKFEPVSSADEPFTQTNDESKVAVSSLLRGPLSTASNNSYKLNIMNFHRNRFARVFPIFYLCTLFALPYWFCGFGEIDPRQVQSILTALFLDLTATISLTNYVGKSITVTGWTVCTLAIMWIIFPFNFLRLHLFTKKQLVNWLVAMYWLQLFILTVSYTLMHFYLTENLAFWVSYTNPFLRYPCFVIGVFGGELSLRSYRFAIASRVTVSTELGKEIEETKESYKSATISTAADTDTATNDTSQHDATSINMVSATNETLSNTAGKVDHSDDNDDWPRTIFLCFPIFTLTENKVSTQYWFYQVQILGFLLPVSFILITLLEKCIGTTIYSFIWLQGTVPFIQLEMIVALTKIDSDRTATTLFLRHPICAYLGKISMNIYLVHFPVIRYLTFIIYGKALIWPDTFDCSNQYTKQTAEYIQCQNNIQQFYQASTMPYWGIFIVVPTAILFAMFLYKYVEEPCRQFLRTPE